MRNNVEERVIQYLELISKEDDDVITKLSSDLLAFKKLKKVKAFTFAELALLSIAKARGLPYKDPLFDLKKEVFPPCPKCGEEKKIYRLKDGRYKCGICKKTFTANHDSISSGANVSATICMKVLICILENKTIEKTCEFCSIAPGTYFHIRMLLTYAMHVMMESQVKLYGNIQVDITELKSNYKGYMLSSESFPENSPLYEQRYVPREARKRGGSYSHKERNKNVQNIYCAIDEFSHVYVKNVGIGKVTTTRLNNHLNKNRFLHEVPIRDPFKFSPKKNTIEHELGKRSLFISDKENALLKYANIIGYPTEAHVYRKKGKQVRIKKTDNDIQKVNSLHSRFKAFVRENGYISSKYLPLLLCQFEFLENTKATDEAILELFIILATPGLKKSFNEYKTLLTIPNHNAQLSDEEGGFHKIPYEQIKCVYYYDIYLKDKASTKSVLTQEYLENETGCKIETIKQYYDNFCVSGILDSAIDYYTQSNIETKNKIRAIQSLSPEMLVMYDDYKQMRLLPFRERPSSHTITEILNEKYSKNFSTAKMLATFKKIEECGLREPLNKIELQISPFHLTAYDDYCGYRLKPIDKRCSKKMFFKHLNEKYNLSYSDRYWEKIIAKIKTFGLREPLPPFNNLDSKTLLAYDEYFAEKQKPAHERVTFKTFCEQLNAKYNKSYKYHKWKYLFNKVEESKIRPPLPKKGSVEYEKIIKGLSPCQQSHALNYLSRYNEIVSLYRAKNETVPNYFEIVKMIAIEKERSPQLVNKYIGWGTMIRKYKLEHEEFEQD